MAQIPQSPPKLDVDGEETLSRTLVNLLNTCPAMNGRKVFFSRNLRAWLFPALGGGGVQGGKGYYRDVLPDLPISFPAGFPCRTQK